ncbi:alpha/beta fold hydrolase [Salibacterium sp. K-3]
MNIDIEGVKVGYHVSGEGADVVLLHGWGADRNAFAPVHQSLEKHFRVWSLDFPGFGDSEEPPEPWDVGDYTRMLGAFLEKAHIDRPTLIGHSFGGRVSIKYASANPVHKVILVDSAGIKPKRKWQYYVKVYTYKAFKKILDLPVLNRYKENILTKVKGKLGSTDYKNVSGTMQQTMVKVVNEDLRHHLPNIQAPTLLVWGEKDEATPVEDARLMEGMIPDAGLAVLENAGHYSYLDKRQQFLLVIDSFLQQDKGERNS